ncbi:MAG: DEAD/DEAH box helicase [Candidatus Promineifilaceae bacterium]
MSFENFGLDARLLGGIKSAGFATPTPIQEQAIPTIMDGRDVMGLAQTGTGKTAAFVLPILQRLTTGPLRQMRALIIAPTRELAEQIHQDTRELGRNAKIRSAAIYGGVSKGPQIKALRSGTEVIIACPGRLLDLTHEGHVDYSRVEIFVLDEADRLFDMGFLPDIRRIISKLPRQRQTLFFSATMPKDIQRLANQELKDQATIQIGSIAPARTVSHALFPVPNNLKKDLLLHMLDNTATGRVLIFTRTKYRARNVARDLQKKGYRAAALQGNMSQSQRQRAIDGFRRGKFDILAATDVASRGIDVADISHVINFDMPDTADAYIHRIGRTGRAHQSGQAYTFAASDDEAMVYQIEKAIGSPIERRRMGGFDYGVFQPEVRPAKKTVYSTPRGRRPRR